MKRASAGKKPTSTNPFHEVRRREFRRKQEIEKGATVTEVQPAYFTPSLQEICAAVIADTFDEQQGGKLDPDLEKLVISQLSTDLRLERAVERVQSESYWKACCEVRWSLGQLTDFTPGKKLVPHERGGWKRIFLERHLEEYLMSVDPSTFGETGEELEETKVASMCRMCGAYVYSLSLARQQYHLDVGELFAKLPHLESLSVTYGTLNAGVNFRMDMIGMKQQDALHMQKVLRSFPSLTRLALPGNSIDADLMKAIAAGLVKNSTLVKLDLSHNRIDDSGVSALSIVLMKKDLALRELDLSDNRIRAEGGKALGKALSVNVVLESLSVRMNRLSDLGGERLFDGIRANSMLRSFNVANNDLGAESARSAAEALRSNPVIQELDLSGNSFGEEGGRMLASAVKENFSLRHIDIRMSGVAESDAQGMAAVTAKRINSIHMDTVDAVENKMRDEIGKQVQEKVRKTHGV